MLSPCVLAFQKLRAALDDLEGASAELAEHGRGLAHGLSNRYEEDRLTHEALLAALQALNGEIGRERELLAQDGEQTNEALQRYRQTLIQAGRGTANEMQGPQNDMDALGEIMFQGLYEQQARLAGLNEAEAQADRVRLQRLAQYNEGQSQAEERLAAIEATLDRGDGALAAAIETEQRLSGEEAARRGVALNRRAALAYGQGHLQTALALLEQAVAEAPGDLLIWLNLARLCLDTGRIERAAQACQAAAGLAPQAAEVRHVEGLLALERGECARAIEILAACAGAAVDATAEVTYRLSLAEAHYRGGHPQPAIEQWRRVLAIEPLQPVAARWLQAIDAGD